MQGDEGCGQAAGLGHDQGDGRLARRGQDGPGAGQPAARAELAGAPAAMPDQEDPLAEQRVPADIAEVLQQDPADEAQVEAGQQEQVSGPRRPAHREDADQVRDGDVASRKYQDGQRATVGQPDRPQPPDHLLLP